MNNPELVRTLLQIQVFFLAATLVILVWQIFFPGSWRSVWKKSGKIVWTKVLGRTYKD